jgi:hypothetical protein
VSLTKQLEKTYNINWIRQISFRESAREAREALKSRRIVFWYQWLTAVFLPCAVVGFVQWAQRVSCKKAFRVSSICPGSGQVLG